MNRHAVQKLELNSVLEIVSGFTTSESGKDAVMSLQPSNELDKADFLLSQCSEALLFINKYCQKPSFNFDSVAQIADKSKILSTLSIRELLRVRHMLTASRSIFLSLSSIHDQNLILLPQLYSAIYTNKAIEEELDFCIVSEEEINDRATPELYRIRSAIRKTNDEIKNKLQGYLKNAEMQKYLQDAIVTVRSDRFVLPVKQEFRSNVGGIVHDQSSSGATVFIEPMAVVELNNKLKILASEEKAEIERILYAFTEQISRFADRLKENEKILTELDTVFAKAKFACEYKAIIPRLNRMGIINLKSARHPLIDRKKIVPITVSLGEKYNILLITGPNTGGKTVALKTVGLFVLMTGCGIPLTCDEESTITVFDEVFCDIGDEQSIEQNLSTFSSHILNISSIIENITKNSLVLLDEVGAGTEPNEGAALALSITECLLGKGVRAIETTHYSLLKEYSLVTLNIENASMEFDPVTFAPTYRLVLGVPGSSNAIEIAKRLGLSESVIQGARARLTQESISFENVLRQAESIRQQYESAKSEVDRIKAEMDLELKKVKNQNLLLETQRDNLLKNSKNEAKRIVNEAQQKAQALIEEIKDILKRGQIEERAVFQARSTAKKIEEIKHSVSKDENTEELFIGEPIDHAQMKNGDMVFVKSLNAAGRIESIEKNKKIKVKIGMISAHVKADDLYNYVDTSIQKATAKQSVLTEIKTKITPSEINLLGKNVDEAVYEVQAFIDNAIIAGHKEVRVVHGMGTGALRRGLHIYFKGCREIEEFRLGKYGEGESGVTILKLRVK